MSTGTVHIVGAGLSGLSAAVALAGRGASVQVYEGAAQAGGRCRSYFDPQLDMVIDNGNHLVLSGNTAVRDYLAAVGASERLVGPDEAAIAFADLSTGDRWTLRPNDGGIPWWVLNPKRRVPQTRALDYLAFAKLASARSGRTVGEVLRGRGPLWSRLIQPFLLAVLNTEPEQGDAGLAAAVVRETLMKGGAACRPRVASPTLAAAFVEPALAYLEAKGATVTLGRRVREIAFEDGRAAALVLPSRRIALGPDDALILAVPPWVAETLVPDLTVPDEHRAIVNGHFKIAPPTSAARIVGVIGGTAEWVFAFEDRVSVTVSGADRLLDADREALARRLWRDVAAVHGLPAALPPWQIVKERRATFAATPAQNAKRPGAATAYANLFLAGDWTNTGLPATIEGSLRSGRTAADLALGRTPR